MATAGPDFRFREVNPALCQMLGYSLDELIGASFLDFVHPDDRAVCLQHGTAMAAGQLARLQLEERFLQKSGEPIWPRGRLSAASCRACDHRRHIGARVIF